MRFYSLVIDGQVISTLNATTPEALRIVFDLRTYDGVELSGMFFDVYNLPQQFYLGQNKLKGKKIELYAGFLPTSPLLKKIEVKPVLNTLLLSGYISNTIGNYIESRMTFILTASPVIPSAQAKQSGVLVDIKKGDSIKQKLKIALQTLYPSSIINAEGLEVAAVEDMQKVCFNSYDLRSIADAYKVGIYTDIQSFCITDWKIQSLYPPIIITQNEIIGNVSHIGLTTIKIDLLLRADLRIGRTIQVDPKLFATISPSTNYITNSPKAFVTGQFIITKIWHLGDSTNDSANSWTTSIEAVMPKG